MLKDHLPADLSWLLVTFAFCTSWGVVLHLVKLWRNETTRRARIPAVGSVGGPLRGRVVFERDADFAMRTTIEQQGKPFDWERRQFGSPKNWLWRESSRNSEQQAFYLELDNDERVRVEPDKHTILALPMSLIQQHPSGDKHRRRITAELQAGASVLIYGHAHEKAGSAEAAQPAAYREPSGQFQVVRGTSQTPLMISLEPLEQDSVAHVQRIALFTILTALCALAFTGLVGVPFLSRAAGDLTTCEVVQVDVARGKSGAVIGYDVTCNTGTVSLNSRLQGPEPLHAILPAKIGHLSSQLGADATVHPLAILAWLALTFIAVVNWLLKRDIALPWYRQKLAHSLEPEAD
jgi:hypothetical protein